MMIQQEQLERWRLILGSSSQETLEKYSGGGLILNSELSLMDEALAAIYDDTEPETSDSRSSSNRSGGKGSSSPRIAKWLGDIRSFFKEDVVSVIQNDAIERKGLKQLLFEPEVMKNLKPDIELVSTFMALRGKIPEKSKDTARELVRAVVDEIMKRLYNNIQRAVTGALNKRRHSPIPSITGIDWKLTINRNLKNYNIEHRKLIPERFYFFERTKRTNNWTVILDMDQSGSMADSIIFGSITGSILASLPSLKTRIVAFDTEIMDLTEQCGNDPVDMIFGIQLGGGTDINKSVAYCRQFIEEPSKTIFIILSDLFEGGNQAALVQKLTEMHESGVKVLCLLALNDRGVPCYDENLTKRISTIGIPCFACTPNLLPDLLEGALKGTDLQVLAKRLTEVKKK